MDKEVEEEDNGNDKLGAQFRDHVIGSRTEEERVQQHQDRTAQKDETIQEEENFSDSVKSAHEDSHWVKLNHGQSSTSEKLRDKAGTVTGSWTMHEEEFQVCEDKRQEEEGDSTDDEDAEHLSNEDVDCNEEDRRGVLLVTIFCLAHRVVLATSSDYFRGMFTSGMRESHQHCVTLPSMLASELEVLIGCSYSGALPLSWRCVFEITSTALQLQCQPALTLCLNFLQEEMNPHSCLDVVSFAEAYEMVQLLEIADDFVLRQFQKVARTLKFRDLPAKQLLKYLNSLSLCVPSELVVFKAVVSWLRAKPKIKLNLAKELMKTIHFTLMTFKEFKEVQSLSMWSDHSLVELYEVVFADFWSNEIKPDSQCRIYLPKESLVLIGGDQISEDLGSRSISRELWFGNSLRNHTGIKKAVEWRRLGEMPEQPRFSHEVAVFEGQLYVFGGKNYYGICDTLNSVYRYDPHQNSWESLAEMQQKRCLFSVVVLDGKIYAIGGHCDAEGIDSVERYCPTENSWSFTWPLDLPLSGHVAKVLQGQMFVSGGLNRDYRCLASMFLYRPETGSTYLADMTEPHAHHCMETLGDFLYVAGGVTTDDRMTLVDQLACEVYSPAADTWTAFTSLPVPHVGAGSAVLEGKFYVLGGYSQEDDSDTNMVHRYDPTTRRWENMGKMPGPNNDIRASVLCLPSHVRL
uniref:Kelch-like family member 33 n=1 Tax=Scophthalmus maximus TaxID=52904 RepID=A0A8D3D803_SCOMX